jgi:hypothetical protein
MIKKEFIYVNVSMLGTIIVNTIASQFPLIPTMLLSAKQYPKCFIFINSLPAYNLCGGHC